jgi:hypothetical protein
MSSPSESSSLLHLEVGEFTQSTYSASLDSNDDPESISRNVVERNLLRKLDFRTAYLVLIYILNQMDRNNAAAARLRGLEEDLGMKGTQFNTLISSLYIGYVFMQTPSNFILTRIAKPSVYLSSCMSLWGLLTTFTGIASNYYQALALRFLVGFLELHFIPVLSICSQDGTSEKSLGTGPHSSLQQSVLATFLVLYLPLEFWRPWRGFSAMLLGDGCFS